MDPIYSSTPLLSNRGPTPGYGQNPSFKDDPSNDPSIIYSKLPSNPSNPKSDTSESSEEVLYGKIPPLESFWEKHRAKIIMVIVILAIIFISYFVAAAWTNSWTLGIKHSCVDDTLGWTPWEKRTCVL